MNTASTDIYQNPIGALRRFAQPRPAPPEHCELCAAPLAEEHDHLLEPATQRLHCACGACAILFSGAENGRYRRVPRRIEAWPDFVMADEQWQALGVPIALAFFFRSSPRNQMVAMYPSPGGATEAGLADEAWEFLCDDNPRLVTLQSDVEALLVNRMHGARDYFRVPIDQCFRLAGLIRTHWRGFSGGDVVWQQMQQFFEQLKARSSGAAQHA